MRIMIIGNFGTSWDGSICDEKHISESLKSMHHKVDEFQRETIEMLGTLNEPDFILIAQWNGYREHVCNHLRELYKCPVVYWVFDYQWDSHEEWHFEMAKEADLFLSKEMDHKHDYEEMGCNFHWLPQDFAPMFLTKEWGKIPFKYEVIFTGSYLPQATFRNELLERLDQEFDLHIFTVTPEGFSSFKNVHGPILDEGLSMLYAESKYVVSVDWKQAEGYWSDRLSQILACNGNPVNKFVSMQELDYPDVTHFNTIDECVDIIKSGKINRNGKPIYVDDRVKQMLAIVRCECLA
jgi:hypothetical protein